MPASAFKRRRAVEGGAEEDYSKVIVRSNGTVTYVGKDIAYQLWKFGLARQGFLLSSLVNVSGRPSGLGNHGRAAESVSPAFGHADQVFNVIDSRQSYLQDVVVAGLNALDFKEQAAKSIHFSYEMVALSPRTCVEMGIPLSEEDKRKPYVEVSGRKGLGVKADDLIDKLIETALTEVEERHPEASVDERVLVSTQIAVGALRYFMLKFTRNSVIAFDFQEALSFEGETGPYVQYAAVRAGKHSRKLEERGAALPDFQAKLTHEVLKRQMESEDFWQIVLAASKAGSAVERAISSGEPAHVAKYAFQLAQLFNNFYHGYPVLHEEQEDRRVFLLWLTKYLRDQLTGTLGILGIEVPPYM